jgi:hypothetical protein
MGVMEIGCGEGTRENLSYPMDSFDGQILRTDVGAERSSY